MQHSCGMTLRLSVFCLCSRQIQRWLLCTRKRNGENDVDGMGKQVPVNTVAHFQVRIDM